METKKILLLWAPLADYSIACLRELALRPNIELSIIYQAGESDAPYDQFDLSFCKSAQAYSKNKEKELFNFCVNLQPDVILMSSWNYRFYMSVSKACRKMGTYVVSTFDGQWAETIKQRVGILTSAIFLKPCIDNFFVPGDRQANFARKLGYKNPFMGYYSANTALFKDVQISQGENKFIFVGRLVHVKGIHYLMNAYKKYRESVSNPWGLILCGKGELEHLCKGQEGVEIHGFTQPSQLPQRLASAKCFILPSTFEPWGLVVHEAALAGLPIITSHKSGASTSYVRDGQNGYVVNPDEDSLLRAMKLISGASDKKLAEMSQMSKSLGMMWTTEKWANYVHQYICNHEQLTETKLSELKSA
ncbi:MAG: glycosyltransferase family 4 protein [Pyrinomonadaceae bacterium]|nr:glycosyltransferase family 4 protein [Sphingobacteriaceae bacterium]